MFNSILDTTNILKYLIEYLLNTYKTEVQTPINRVEFKKITPAVKYGWGFSFIHECFLPIII